MEKNNPLGVVLATLGALLNIFGIFIIFMTWYEKAQVMETL